jgi:hypothetical protein
MSSSISEYSSIQSDIYCCVYGVSMTNNNGFWIQ